LFSKVKSDEPFGLRDKYTYLEAEPNKHTHTLIFFHGLNPSVASRTHEQNKYTHLFKDGEKLENLKVVLPVAPKRYLTCRRRVYESWYDVFNLEEDEDNTTKNLLKDGKFEELSEHIYKEHN